MRNHGFTLVELISVIILLGILSVYATPHIFSSNDTDVIAAQNTLVSILRLQQQRALQDTAAAAKYGVNLTHTENQFVITKVGPAGVAFEPSVMLPGVSFTASTPAIAFNALGCVVECGQSDVVINLIGNTNQSVCINREGYISQGNCE